MFHTTYRLFLLFYLLKLNSGIPLEKSVDKILDSIFGPLTDKNDNFDESIENKELDDQNNQCQCLRAEMCDDHNAHSGFGAIDIRMLTECKHSDEICCKHPKQKEEAPITTRPFKWNPNECGYRNPNGIDLRIRNDDLNSYANFGEFPWMVAILKEEIVENGQKLNVYLCGGSLIHQQIVLTAAHCVYKYSRNKNIKIRAGDWDTQSNSELLPHQDRNISNIIIHERFYPGALFYDYALIILEKPLTLMDNVDIICLPKKNINYDKEKCIASGWGKNGFGRNGTFQIVLRKVELPIVSRFKCVQSLRQTRLGPFFQLHKSFLCAGGESNRDTCQGDGGSPLICPISIEDDEYYDSDLNMYPQHYVQVGIVSWGIGCGQKDIPGVYANVPFISTWIEKQINHFDQVYNKK